MIEPSKHRSGSQKRKTVQRNIALYPQDVEGVERVRKVHKLDSFSQAVRRVIRDAVELLEAGEKAA